MYLVLPDWSMELRLLFVWLPPQDDDKKRQYRIAALDGGRILDFSIMLNINTHNNNNNKQQVEVPHSYYQHCRHIHLLHFHYSCIRHTTIGLVLIVL